MKNKIFILIAIIISFSVIMLRNDDSTTKVISYNGNNLRISIDGESANTFPTSGNYYLVDYSCDSSKTKVTWDRENHELNVTNSINADGVLCYLEFKSKPLLSEMPAGSYVAYTGNNGCDDTNDVNGYDSCSGKNANYVSDTDKGYCYTSDRKFITNGWRIGYVKTDSATKETNAYIISAGAPECMCTNRVVSGDDSVTLEPLSSGCSVAAKSSEIDAHYNAMDAISLKYCNPIYSAGAVCDISTTWAMDDADYEEMIDKNMTISSCKNNRSNNLCGYTNDLIDVGSHYWFASWSSGIYSYIWSSMYRVIRSSSSRLSMGVRPVIKLDSRIKVSSGSGTYEDPYQLLSGSLVINGGAKYTTSNTSINLAINSASDDVSTMCISIDDNVCGDDEYISFSSSYTKTLSGISDGELNVYVYCKDSNGEIVDILNSSIIIDTIAPSLSVNSSGNGGLNVTFVADSEPNIQICFSGPNVASNCRYTPSSGRVTYFVTLPEGTSSRTYTFKATDGAGHVTTKTISYACTSNCYKYKYFMDFKDDGNLYLVRSDGLTGNTDMSDKVNWYGSTMSNSNFFKSCDISKSSTYIWCLGTDNKVYYKPSYTTTNWAVVSFGTLSSTYSYSLVSSNSSGVLVVSSNGTMYKFTQSGYSGINTSGAGAGTGLTNYCVSGNDLNDSILCLSSKFKLSYFQKKFTVTSGNVLNPGGSATVTYNLTSVPNFFNPLTSSDEGLGISIENVFIDFDASNYYQGVSFLTYDGLDFYYYMTKSYSLTSGSTISSYDIIIGNDYEPLDCAVYKAIPYCLFSDNYLYGLATITGNSAFQNKIMSVLPS